MLGKGNPFPHFTRRFSAGPKNLSCLLEDELLDARSYEGELFQEEGQTTENMRFQR